MMAIIIMMLLSGVLVFFCSSASGHSFSRGGSEPDGFPDLRALSRAFAEEEEEAQVSPRGYNASVYGPLPGTLRVRASADYKALLSPELGARPLPPPLKRILQATAPPAVTAPPVRLLMAAVCHVDRLYVRVARSMFRNKLAYKYLKLGSCPVNHGTNKYYYFLYLLTTGCGFIETVSGALPFKWVHYW